MPAGSTPALPPCALHTERRTFAHSSDAFRTLFHMASPGVEPGGGRILSTETLPQSSSPRKSSDSSSPEFEFWKVRNVCAPEPVLSSADELFSDGVLLPLHLLRETQLRAEDKVETATEREPEPLASAVPPPILAAAIAEPVASTSMRWKDIFKIGEKKVEDVEAKEKGRKKKEKKYSAGGGGTGSLGAADLNINIWPFARSRSAGTGAARPKAGPGPPRKTSSAPCSRSNSGGESKSKRWPASPGRMALAGGVHLGRSSPVWQVRRSGNGGKPASESEVRSSRRATDGSGRNNGVNNSKIRVLNLNVPLCIGYRHNLSCSSDNDGTATGQGAGKLNTGGDGNGNGGNGSLFNFRNLFSKKVY
ncbi:uncharacterized protein [Aristolochia californica]|uniref:uncharacterized protein n=1 Tax=Aristolochia californica TaxID=171875 RepID=UPI0035D9B61B